MIRPATPADAQALLNLAASTPGAPTWTPTHYRNLLTNPNHTTLLLQPAADIFGFITLSLLPPTAELESIAVHPAHQRHGHGRALLTAALRHIAALGIHTVQLEVRDPSPAIALYRALGFLPNGRRPRYYTHPTQDAILMQWTSPETPVSDPPLSGIIKVDYGS